MTSRCPSGREAARPERSTVFPSTWRPGEILGVVGESGCGKSTLARAMLGLVEPGVGELALDGAVVRGETGLRELRRRVQMIFQDPYQTLNPRQRVQIDSHRAARRSGHRVLGARGQGHARAGGRRPRAGAVSDRYPHQLSGGQRQRVAIAAALVLEPDGLICDEPVSMLDASVRSQILKVLIELQARRGLALLFITHDLSVAWSLCDRISVMYLGRIVEQGSATDVIERPTAPVHPGAGGRGAGADRGRRWPPRAPEGRAARPDGGALGMPLPPALSAALRALRPGRSEADPGGRARTSLRPACSTTRRWAARRPRPPLALTVAERWRDIAGPVGVLKPGPRNAITDVSGVRVGHAQAESGERTGVTVVAPPTLPTAAGVAVDQRHRCVDAPSRDRRGRLHARRRSTSAGRTPSGPSTRRRSRASGRGPITW